MTTRVTQSRPVEHARPVPTVAEVLRAAREFLPGAVSIEVGVRRTVSVADPPYVDEPFRDATVNVDRQDDDADLDQLASLGNVLRGVRRGEDVGSDERARLPMPCGFDLYVYGRGGLLGNLELRTGEPWEVHSHAFTDDEPEAARCDCEHARCSAHEAGACDKPATVCLDSYGHRQRLCGACADVGLGHEPADRRAQQPEPALRAAEAQLANLRNLNADLLAALTPFANLAPYSEIVEDMARAVRLHERESLRRAFNAARAAVRRAQQP